MRAHPAGIICTRMSIREMLDRAAFAAVWCPPHPRIAARCHRVLVPGGIARIAAAADLGKIVGLYGHSGDPEGERYIALVTDTFLKWIGGYKASFVINNGFPKLGPPIFLRRQHNRGTYRRIATLRIDCRNRERVTTASHQRRSSMTQDIRWIQRLSEFAERT